VGREYVNRIIEYGGTRIAEARQATFSTNIGREIDMDDITRISAAAALKMNVAGSLLVCAYDSEQTFKRNHLAGGISLQEFQARVPSLDKNTEIVFYCA